VSGETGPLLAGVAVPVDLKTLITAFRVSPAAAPCWVALIRDVCARFGIDAEVGQSTLLRHPAYMHPSSRPIRAVQQATGATGEVGVGQSTQPIATEAAR
jgi:hypothetical protein